MNRQFLRMILKDTNYRNRYIEHLAEQVHISYLETCKRLGWEVKEENKVEYSKLSEDSKELGRVTSRTVLKNILHNLELL